MKKVPRLRPCPICEEQYYDSYDHPEEHGEVYIHTTPFDPSGFRLIAQIECNCDFRIVRLVSMRYEPLTGYRWYNDNARTSMWKEAGWEILKDDEFEEWKIQIAIQLANIWNAAPRRKK
jgi:hypothetical protein